MGVHIPQEMIHPLYIDIVKLLFNMQLSLPTKLSVFGWVVPFILPFCETRQLQTFWGIERNGIVSMNGRLRVVLDEARLVTAIKWIQVC